jgi:hypothetical protein
VGIGYGHSAAVFKAHGSSTATLAATLAKTALENHPGVNQTKTKSLMSHLSGFLGQAQN